MENANEVVTVSSDTIIFLARTKYVRYNTVFSMASKRAMTIEEYQDKLWRLETNDPTLTIFKCGYEGFGFGDDSD